MNMDSNSIFFFDIYLNLDQIKCGRAFGIKIVALDVHP